MVFQKKSDGLDLGFPTILFAGFNKPWYCTGTRVNNEKIWRVSLSCTRSSSQQRVNKISKGRQFCDPPQRQDEDFYRLRDLPIY